MERTWTALILLSATLVAVNSLTCNFCVIGVFGNCFFPSETSCDNATSSCYVGDAQFNATGSIALHTRGCVDNDLCNETVTGTVLTAGYTSTITCCDGDRCNGAAAVHVSLGAVLCAAVLASMWGGGAF
ncbi:unnamed protein product [Ophioblennius macclurei]